MLLVLTALGYQSCWYEGHITDTDRIGYQMAQILGVPDEYDLVCFLPVGIAESEPVLPQKKEFEERVVKINRITKVVKGGRRMRFSALVVVGDKKGRIGFGTGKAKEVPDAIRKATENAQHNLFRVNLVGTTIPHEVVGTYGAGSVVLRPAATGTGVIAGGPVRAVLELAGVTDVISKCLGSRTAVNVVRATCEGLKSMTSIEKVSDLRGKKPQEIRY